MRFVCDSCRAQYMISDEKVGPKGVKVRCKKCGYVILVRRADGAAPAEAPAPVPAADFGPGLSTEAPPVEPPAPASPSADAPQGSPVFGGVEDDEIGAVFDQVLKSGPHKLEEKPAINALTPPPENEDLSLGMDGEDLASTRVVSTDALKKLAEQAEAHALDQADTRKVPVPNDWFVAVDDQQVGPLTLERAKDMWDRGEIGPDSLCWRAGMADWMPLSEVKELASELAPKPQKPVIAAPATSGVGTVVNVPVDHPFAGGGVGTSVRAEVAMFPSGGASEPAADVGGWKPSAASALASLVSEEMSALSKKPAPKSLLESGPRDIPAGLAALGRPAAASAAPPTGGLLDLPAEPSARVLPQMPTPSGAPVLTPAGGGAALAQSPGAPYAGPMFGGQAAYPNYGAPPVVARPGISKGLKIGLGVGGVTLAALAGVIVFLLIRPMAAEPVAAPPVAAVPPAAATRTELPMPPPPTGTTPAAASPETATAAASTGTAAPATATPPPAAVAAGTETKPEPTAVAAKPEPTAAAAKPEPVATRTPSTTTTKRTTTTAASRGQEDEDGDAIVASTRRTAEPPAPTGGGDDDFDALFGEKKSAPAGGTTKKRSAGYIPPAPGAADLPERLGQSDIMGVVLEHKAAIKSCVDEQKAKQPDLSGTLVVRWTIQTTGRTSGVSVQSDEFRSTPMAGCIVGLVKKMQFPKHRVQGEPINFPFKF